MAAALIALAAMAAYANSLRVPFFFDDTAAIVDNPTIRQLSAVGQVLSPPRDGSSAMGRPVVNLSLAINYAIGGENPRSYHVFNVALHAVAGLLLFGITRRTLRDSPPPARYAHVATPIALAIALLWVVHPLQTESVTCVVQRTELLMGGFFLLTLYCFIRSTETGAARTWPPLCIAACALGMASKEVMVVAPLLVLLYDRTFVAGSFRDAWRQRRWLHASLAATWVLLAFLALQSGGARGAAAGFGLGVTPWSYLLKQCDAIITYLRLAVWPHPLVIDYGTGVVTDFGQVAVEAFVLAALFAATLVALYRRPVVGFLGAWFFAILAPSSSIVPLVTQTMAEHRMYLPLASVIAMFCAASYVVAGNRTNAIAVMLALPLGLGAIARNFTLQDELGLWADAIAKRPDNPRAYASYALALSERGRHAEAIPVFARALELDPKSVATHQNIANALVQIGKLPEAIAHYRRAIALNPNYAGAHNSLGVALQRSGDTDSALLEFRQALKVDPALPGAHRNLARALFDHGLFSEAAAHYARVVESESKPSSEAHYDLGLALARAGDLAAATNHFDEALRLKPTPIGFNNYGLFLMNAGRPAEAAARFAEALRLKPDYREAEENLNRARSALDKTPSPAAPP